MWLKSGFWAKRMTQGTSIQVSFWSNTKVRKQIIEASLVATWLISNFPLSTAVGCPDPIPPIQGWVKRINNEIVIGCNSTGTTPRWKMHCENNQWIGSYKNCTGEVQPQNIIMHLIAILATIVIITSPTWLPLMIIIEFYLLWQSLLTMNVIMFLCLTEGAAIGKSSMGGLSTLSDSHGMSCSSILSVYHFHIWCLPLELM